MEAFRYGSDMYLLPYRWCIPPDRPEQSVFPGVFDVYPATDSRSEDRVNRRCEFARDLTLSSSYCRISRGWKDPSGHRNYEDSST